MLLHLLVVGSLSCLSHFAAAQVINNTILDVPKETPGVAPAVLPQCVIGEEGCRGVQVMDLIDPVAWISEYNEVGGRSVLRHSLTNLTLFQWIQSTALYMKASAIS